MKKSKILFCGLLIGLSVLSYLIITPKSSASELLFSNVEALSQDESERLECVHCAGFCSKDGYVYVGMKFSD